MNAKTNKADQESRKRAREAVEIKLVDELPPADGKLYVYTQIHSFSQLKTTDGEALIVVGPVGFLPVFDSLAELRTHYPTGDAMVMRRGGE